MSLLAIVHAGLCAEEDVLDWPHYERMSMMPVLLDLAAVARGNDGHKPQ
jgi:hypothetical protein